MGEPFETCSWQTQGADPNMLVDAGLANLSSNPPTLLGLLPGLAKRAMQSVTGIGSTRAA